ncbi:hypothetical protein ZIOFF_037506 [Zingiber officinale]|uniref:CCHC-type domain-containing protein n=1 Tax=Zingiber officinale TaxID=94328 RepID=A0A8J5GF24_ZINOF|nr:hypothetical protein ZIOFF_037506 [Zingiber officinale]
MRGHETAPPAPLLLPFSSEKGYAFSFDVLRTQTRRRCSAATVTVDRRHQPSLHLPQLLAREVVPTAESGVALQKLASAEGFVVLCLASVVVSDIYVVSILQKEMEASGSGFSSTTPPVFDGENYQAWAVKMSTFMEGSDLWEAVKDDYEVTPLPDNPTINQIRFHKYHKEGKGEVVPLCCDEKIRGMKALNLMREFERQQMKENEAVKDFSDRLINLANRIRVLGTDMKDDRIVQKILVSLPERFEATIASPENTKDLSDIRLAELLSALEAQEQRRLMRREVPVDAMEGALPARSQMRASGREKKSWNQQKGNADGSSSTNHPHYKCWRRPDVKCNNCHKFGHIARFCQEKDSRQDAIEGAANNEVELMFTASCFATDRSFCAKVKIGNGDYIDVEGRGDVDVDGLKGRKLISDVLYVPKINQNLLSVGQLVQKGCKVMFEEGFCLIADSSGKEILKIQMKNKSFSFDPVSQGQQAMATQDNEAELWHRRLEHFHSKGIEFLDKLDQKAEVGIFIGYSMQSKAYGIYQPQNGKVIMSRDVKFFKEEKWIWSSRESVSEHMSEMPVLVERNSEEKNAEGPEMPVLVERNSEEQNAKGPEIPVLVERNSEEQNAKGQNIEQQLSSEQNVDDTPIRGSVDDMKSTSGYCFSLRSACFSWCSKKQEIVAQSTVEAEFVAPTSAVNQAIWLRKLLNDMSYIMEKETKVSVDNQAALAISKNPVFHGKTKHFNVKYYYLREVQQMGEVELIYCTTEDQLADIFTKSFHQRRFVWLREKIGKVALQKLASAEGSVVLCLASVVVSDIDAGYTELLQASTIVFELLETT